MGMQKIPKRVREILEHYDRELYILERVNSHEYHLDMVDNLAGEYLEKMDEGEDGEDGEDGEEESLEDEEDF